MPVNQDPLLFVQGCVDREGEGEFWVAGEFPCWEDKLHGERGKLRHGERTCLTNGEWVSWDFLLLKEKQI